MVNYPCRVFSLIGALIFKFEFVFLHCIVKKQIKGMGFHHPLKLVFGFYPFHYFIFPEAVYNRATQKLKCLFYHEAIFEMSLSVSLLTGK